MADLEAASGYVSSLQRSGAERGLVEFTALLVLLARATLDRVEAEGAGSKLSRSEVGCIAHRLCAALDRGEPPLSG